MLFIPHIYKLVYFSIIMEPPVSELSTSCEVSATLDLEGDFTKSCPTGFAPSLKVIDLWGKVIQSSKQNHQLFLFLNKLNTFLKYRQMKRYAYTSITCIGLTQVHSEILIAQLNEKLFWSGKTNLFLCSSQELLESTKKLQ